MILKIDFFLMIENCKGTAMKPLQSNEIGKKAIKANTTTIRTKMVAQSGNEFEIYTQATQQ